MQAAYFPDDTCARLDTAREALSLVKTLEGGSGNVLIGKLADFNLQAKEAALAASLANASTLDQALELADWEIFVGIKALTDDRKDAAQLVWQDLGEAFDSDEYAVALVPKLSELRKRAVDLLTKLKPPEPDPAPDIITPPPPPPKPTRTQVALKKLYTKSQVKADELPDWLDAAAKQELLEVHTLGSDHDDWKTSVVVGPLYAALIRLDGNARIDLEARKLILPKFDKEVPLDVKDEHLDS